MGDIIYKYSILVVDDDQQSLKVLVSFLEKNNYNSNIFLANNGKAAYDIASKKPVDLIILDWEMPIMNGIETVSILKNEYKTKDIPIIMATANSSPDRLREAFDKGVIDFISKPINELELLARVNSALKISDSFKKIKQQNEEIQQKNFKLMDAQAKLLKQTEDLKLANDEIIRQKEVIQEQTVDIIESIGYAQHIQNAMLPFEDKIANFLPEFFILYRPKDVVSGDFYFFSEKNYKTIIAAVDCTGHGVPGAFMSMIGNELFNQTVNWQGISEPHKVLTELHRGIRRVLKQEETGNFDGMDLAVCVVDNYTEDFIPILGEPKMEYAGAHNPLLLIQNNEMQFVKGDRFAVGGYLHKDEQTFVKHTFEIYNRDTTFYVFSDGYQDQFNGSDKKRFRIKQLKQLLFDIHQKDTDEQYEIVANTLDDWMTKDGKKVTQMDDILLIGVKLRNNNFILNK